ncbi:hypothetical protein Mapa_011304 [Marchantia paleacea]|nr:hypothetical protein Mapa_011304 [Marchantia paleacea]
MPVLIHRCKIKVSTHSDMLGKSVQNLWSNVGGSSKSRGRLRSKPYEAISEESICEMCKARQPLMPLQANSVDRKVSRRQHPAVDGTFY